jgi:hypothetical protein
MNPMTSKTLLLSITEFGKESRMVVSPEALPEEIAYLRPLTEQPDFMSARWTVGTRHFALADVDAPALIVGPDGWPTGQNAARLRASIATRLAKEGRL